MVQKEAPVIAKNNTTEVQKAAKIESATQKKNLVSKEKEQITKTQKTVTKQPQKKQAKPISKQIVKTTSKPIVVKEKPITPNIAPLNEEVIEEVSKKFDQIVLDEEQINQGALKEITEETQPKTEIQEPQAPVFAPKAELLPKRQNKIESFKDDLVYLNYKIKNKLENYGLNIVDILIMLFAGITSFVVMYLILNRKNNETIKLKSRADLFEKVIKSDNLNQEKKQEKKKDDKFFIFDGNIKQTGFYKPAQAIKKNYELLSYNPDFKNAYETEEDRESAIIQKILKDDTLIEVAPGEYEIREYASKTEIAPKNKVTSSPIDNENNLKKKINATMPQVQEEPTVLSSVEISPQSGFMVVSYQDNINLVGFVFDDVFPLYNFNQPKLESYEIKYRLSEKDDKGADFIVKINNTKLLIRATNSMMKLEVVL